jgi:purine catabolism regulator
LRARAPALPPLTGGEVVVASISALESLDGRPSLALVVEQVAQLGGAALLVLGSVDAAAERAAELHQLPLVLVHASARPEALEVELQRWLVQRKIEAQRELSTLHLELTGLALAGGFPALLERTTRLTGKSAILLGPDWAVRLRRQPPTGGVSVDLIDAAMAVGRPAAERWARERDEVDGEPSLVRLGVPELGLLQLVAGVRDGVGLGAYLSLVGRAGEIGEADADTLLAAAGAGTIELVREHASEAARAAVEGDVLDRLSDGDTHGEDGLRRRASRLGYDLDQPHVALAVRASTAADDQVLETLQRLAPETSLLAGRRGEQILALLPCAPDEPPGLRSVHDWYASATAVLGRLTVGVGGPAGGVHNLAQALGEARQALQLGERLLGNGRVIAFADLGIFTFLLRSHAPEALRAFYGATLGRLAAYDEARGAELLPTLEAYFASRCSPDATAKRLHLHRNSLLYRLRRIEEIAGVRLHDPETRLQLHLGLRVGQILPAPGL